MADNIENATSGAGRPQVVVRDTSDKFKELDKYKQMEYSYAGSGGFRDGRFIVPHGRERKPFYDERREISVYTNFVKPVIDARYLPVFSGDKVDRETNSELFSNFLQSVNFKGETIHDVMKRAALWGNKYGVCFVVIDNVVVDGDVSIADAIGNRFYPYMYTKKPHTVDWDALEIGESGKIERIRFWVKSVNNGKKKIDVYREYDAQSVSDILVAPDKEEKVSSLYEHGLGVVPVYPVVFSEDEQEDLRYDPPAYSIAMQNFSLFQKDSEMRSLERAQGFAILYAQVDAASDLELGTHSMMIVPPEANMPPGFISPDSSIMRELRENRNKLVEEIFQSAQQIGVIGVMDESGVAKQWDFRAEEEVLRETSRVMELAEIWVSKIFALYVNDSGLVYDVDYPKDFQPVNTTAEVNVITDTLERVVWPPQSSANLKSKLYSIVMADRPEDETLSAVDEIKLSASDEIRAEDVGFAV